MSFVYQTFFVIARYPRPGEYWGVKDSEHVYYSAGGQWTKDWDKAVCFRTENSALVFRGQMKAKWKDAGAVVTRIDTSSLPRSVREFEWAGR